MGIRSMNYIALKPGVALSPEVQQYLNNETATVLEDRRGTLVVYQSNSTPMHARDGRGANCVYDLEEEIAVHRFLGSIPTDCFYMKRAGDECDHRGNWQAHSFQDEPCVEEIEADFQRAFAGFGHHALDETPPYLVMDGWGHIFDGFGEKTVRFVYNRNTSLVECVQVKHGVRGWLPANEAQRLDVEDSLKNGNPDAIDNPDDFGFTECHERPSWASSPKSERPEH